MHYCYQENYETGALLFSGERKWFSTVFRRRDLVLYCFQEKGSGTLLFSGEGHISSTVLREGDWCSTDLRRSKLVQGALLFSGERNW